jgi:hypothetical protein
MATPKLAPGGGRFFAFGSTIVRNDASICNDLCILGEDCSTTVGNGLGTTHIHLTRLVGVRGWAKSQVPWCNTHNLRVGVQMAKLAMLQLV